MNPRGGDLSRAGLAAQLHDQLVYLSEPARAQRLSLGQQATGRIHWYPAAQLRVTAAQQLYFVSRGA